ncbi:MAG: aquaporin [Chloroflexota bacterium]
MDTRKLLAEVVGTFILVGMGSMSILAVGAIPGSPALVVIPFGFGFGLLAAIAVSGHASGGHFNPAVTLGALLDGRIDAMGAVGYVVAQVIGAIGASAMILALSSQAVVAGTKNMPGVGDGGAFLTEIVLTAIFVAVILTVTRKDAGHAIIVIPLTLLVIHAVGIPFSGASVNPARALGPAIVSMDFAAIWIYLTAPFIGAVVGWIVFRALSAEEPA